MFATSHFEPSLTKTSSRSSPTPRLPYSARMTASIRKSYPCSGPYPRKVSQEAISPTARCIASTTAGTSGRVTSPMPSRMMSASGWASLKAATFFATAAKR